MTIPSHLWGKLALAESLITYVINQPTEWPTDLRSDDLAKLKAIVEALHEMLSEEV
jgi:hypothetical protein